MDDYVKEAKKLLDLEVELQIECLVKIARKNDLEPDWALRNFRDKLIYKLKEMGIT